MKLSEKLIKEIAGELDTGMICYVHKKTKEIKTLPNRDEWFHDLELWEEAFEEVDTDYSNFIKIEKMSCRDAFRIMEDFIYEVNDEKIRDRLYYALNRPKPFQNFKYEIRYYEEILQQWYLFKESRYMSWVRHYLETSL